MIALFEGIAFSPRRQARKSCIGITLMFLFFSSCIWASNAAGVISVSGRRTLLTKR
jgi:hypothetical protein